MTALTPEQVERLARALCKEDGKVWWTDALPAVYRHQAQALAPVVAAMLAEAEQRGREDNADHGMCYVSGSVALEARLAEARAEATEDAIAHLEDRLVTFAQRGRHTRAWWAVAVLRDRAAALRGAESPAGPWTATESQRGANGPQIGAEGATEASEGGR